MGRFGKLVPWLLVASWTLLSVAWVMASAPFGAPDEAEHYFRTVGISKGALIGKKPPVPTDINTPSGSWYSQTARLVTIPAGTLPPPAGCFAHNRNASAACAEVQPSSPVKMEVTIGVGAYQPLPYLLPAAAMKLSESSIGRLRLARFGGLLFALLMLAAAVAVLRAPDGNPLALLGPMLAVTPMVVYVASSLTGSGLEVASGIAFVAALLRLTRADTCPKWVWAVIAASGVALALSRASGPIWVLLALVLMVLLRGPRESWQVAHGGGRAAIGAGAGVLLAVAVNRIWEAAYGIQHLPIGFESMLQALRNSAYVLRDVTPQFIGRFGYLEFGLSRLTVDAWLAAVALLVIVALLVETWRQRIVLAACVAGAAAVPMVLYIAIFRHTGVFGLQGRHVLAIVVAVPLLAGELAYRRRDRLPSLAARSLVIVVPLVVAAVQLVAWFTVARRYAIGLDGPVNFLSSPEWSPPLGWAPWFVLTCLAIGPIAAVAVIAARHPTIAGLRSERPREDSART